MSFQINKLDIKVLMIILMLAIIVLDTTMCSVNMTCAFVFCFFFLAHCESFPSTVKNGLSKLGVPSNVLDFMFDWTGANEDYPKVPEAKGSIQAVRNEAFFIPLYELFLTYGGIFRLTFGPKVCVLCFIMVEG